MTSEDGRKEASKQVNIYVNETAFLLINKNKTTKQ